MNVFKSLYQNIKEIVNNSDNLKGIRLYVDKSNKKAQNVYNTVGMCGEHYQLFEWMKD